MLRPSLALVAAVTLPLFSGQGPTLGGGQGAVVTPACQNILRHEPVLVWDVTGSTLTGPLHERASVYNSGLVTVSSAGGFLEGTGSASFGYVPQEAVAALRDALVAAGAHQLCDQDFTVSDVPLTTVTVFFGDTNARAHTFSYWGAEGEYAAVGTVIADFLATYFPGF